MHFAVKGVLFAFIFLQLCNDVFNVLASSYASHQYGVGRFHHDQVFKPQDCHGVLRVLEQRR
jgi:hypothetical protein